MKIALLCSKHLGQRYVQYINRTYRRSGTLWEGRFRSCLTQTEDDVLACYRYIELNPVRAQMVDNPADYPWSSFRFNGEGGVNHMLSPHREYLRLGISDIDRQLNYKALFEAHLEPGILEEIRSSTNRNYVLVMTTLNKKLLICLNAVFHREKLVAQ